MVMEIKKYDELGIEEYKGEINRLLNEIERYGFAIIDFRDKHGIENLDNYLNVLGCPEFVYPLKYKEEVTVVIKKDYVYSLEDLTSSVKEYYSRVAQEAQNIYLNKRFEKKMFRENFGEVKFPKWIEIYGIRRMVCVEDLWLEAHIVTDKDENLNWTSRLCPEYYFDYYDKNREKNWFNSPEPFKVDIRQKQVAVGGELYSIDPAPAALELALKKIESKDFQQKFYFAYYFFLKEELERHRRTYLFLLSQCYEDELVALDNGDDKVIKSSNVKRGPTRRIKRVGAKANN